MKAYIRKARSRLREGTHHSIFTRSNKRYRAGNFYYDKDSDLYFETYTIRKIKKTKFYQVTGEFHKNIRGKK